MILRNGKAINIPNLRISTNHSKLLVSNRNSKNTAIIFNTKNRGYPVITPCNARK